MDKGWVLLHRKLHNSPLWEDKPFAEGQAFLDLVMLATSQDIVTYIKGKPVTLKRGQYATSLRKLSERWGWSRQKVDRFLKDQKNQFALDTKTDTKMTVITIANYEFYQNPKYTKMTAEMTHTEEVRDTEMTVIRTQKGQSKMGMLKTSIFGKKD